MGDIMRISRGVSCTISYLKGDGRESRRVLKDYEANLMRKVNEEVLEVSIVRYNEIEINQIRY